MLLAAQLAMLLADLLSCPAANCQLLMRHCRLRRGPPGRLRRRWNGAACWSSRSARRPCPLARRGCASPCPRRTKRPRWTGCSTRWLICRRNRARAAPYNDALSCAFSPMNVVNIAAYRFVALDDLSALRERVRERAETLALKGSEERRVGKECRSRWVAVP